MSHPPEEETLKLLAEAGKKVIVDSIYFHYKNPQNTYRVLHLALQEATDKVCVIYQAQYGSKLIFVRDLDSWLESVIIDDQTVSRFTKIS